MQTAGHANRIARTPCDGRCWHSGKAEPGALAVDGRSRPCHLPVPGGPAVKLLLARVRRAASAGVGIRLSGYLGPARRGCPAAGASSLGSSARDLQVPRPQAQARDSESTRRVGRRTGRPPLDSLLWHWHCGHCQAATGTYPHRASESLGSEPEPNLGPHSSRHGALSKRRRGVGQLGFIGTITSPQLHSRHRGTSHSLALASHRSDGPARRAGARGRPAPSPPPRTQRVLRCSLQARDHTQADATIA
jgi:hypothetical protein